MWTFCIVSHLGSRRLWLRELTARGMGVCTRLSATHTRPLTRNSRNGCHSRPAPRSTPRSPGSWLSRSRLARRQPILWKQHHQHNDTHREFRVLSELFEHMTTIYLDGEFFVETCKYSLIFISFLPFSPKIISFGNHTPGFPDQADHNLTILWHHTNHTNFLTLILPWSASNYIWFRVWSAWNHKFLFQTRVDVTCIRNNNFPTLRRASFIGWGQ